MLGDANDELAGELQQLRAELKVANVTIRELRTVIAAERSGVVDIPALPLGPGKRVN